MSSFIGRSRTFFKVTGTPPNTLQLAVATACIAFAFYYAIFRLLLPSRTLIDPDVFMHITVGNWMLAHGQFPLLDQLSQTARGKIWRAADWGSEIVFATLYDLGRWSAVSAAVAAGVGATAAILTAYLVSILRLSIGLGLASVVMLLISPHFLARPVLFSYILLLIWCILLLEIHDRGKWAERSAFVLAPVMLIWANLHSSFTFGLAIFGFFLVEACWAEYRRAGWGQLARLAPITVTVGACAISTPYGIFSALRTVILMRIPALYEIDEWGATDLRGEKAYLFFLLGLIALLIYFRIRLRGARFATFLLTLAFALQYKRGLGLLALISPLLIARPLSIAVPWVLPNFSPPDVLVRALKTRAFPIVAISISATILSEVVDAVRPFPSPPSAVAPESALAAARSASLNGNVFNSYNFGGYLLLNQVPPFVDGRVALYGNEFLQRYFAIKQTADPLVVREFLTPYDIKWALLSPGEPVVRGLEADGWVSIYRDQDAVVLTHPAAQANP